MSELFEQTITKRNNTRTSSGLADRSIIIRGSAWLHVREDELCVENDSVQYFMYGQGDADNLSCFVDGKSIPAGTKAALDTGRAYTLKITAGEKSFTKIVVLIAEDLLPEGDISYTYIGL